MHIKSLQLFTADITSALRDFYVEVLGLKMIQATADKLTLQAGMTQLEFQRRAEEAYYHFAFNIPENQFAEGKAWLQARVSLISDSAGADEFSFRAWNAHSVYFRDPANNILELIARHDLPNASDQPFSGESLLSISEIGLAFEDVRATAANMHETFGLDYFRGKGGDDFQAMGDDNGLFILVKPGRIWFPESGVPAYPYPMTVTTDTFEFVKA